MPAVAKERLTLDQLPRDGMLGGANSQTEIMRARVHRPRRRQNSRRSGRV